MTAFVLKYCERCGTLGLRDEESDRIYCQKCERKMAQTYLAPSELRRVEVVGKKPVLSEWDLEACVPVGGTR